MTPSVHRPGSGPSREVRLRRTIICAVLAAVLGSTMIGYVRQHASPALAASRPITVPAGGGTPMSAPSTPPPRVPAAARPTASARGSAPSGARTSRPAPTTPVADAADGTFQVVAVPGPASTATGRAVSYGVQVEKGLGADTARVARTVRSVLLDPRGWQGVDHVRFVALTPEQIAAGARPQIMVTLASPRTTDRLCAPARTQGRWSCFNDGRAVLNYRRWVNAVPAFGGNTTGYREYLVNHEVGHGLGHHHRTCATKGAAAPVMQEQSMGLHGCTAWFWPMSPQQAARARS